MRDDRFHRPGAYAPSAAAERMPTELKKLAARGASATVKRFEPARVRRQQRALLYGGGAAVTVFILACAVLIV
ncbi:hypothetical protein, partial [Burkholderia multivorans]|uniref:hypothetical protein n=1 Tax=Burkholderia multivorans TaxID=87883 RepID=UPI0028702757